MAITAQVSKLVEYYFFIIFSLKIYLIKHKNLAYSIRWHGINNYNQLCSGQTKAIEIRFNNS